MTTSDANGHGARHHHADDGESSSESIDRASEPMYPNRTLEWEAGLALHGTPSFSETSTGRAMPGADINPVNPPGSWMCPHHPCRIECVYTRQTLLADHRLRQERVYGPVRARCVAAEGWAEWLCELKTWEWFVTVTFRDEVRDRPRTVEDVKAWMRDGTAFSTGSPSWVLSEEWGAATGRFHMHGLVAGVRGLSHRFMWLEGFRRFGRTRIETCRKGQAVAHYAAKYATKQLGNIWLGGSIERGIDSVTQLYYKLS